MCTSAGFASTTRLHLTAEELAELGTDLMGVIDAWLTRSKAHQEAADPGTAGILFMTRASKVTP